jgi:hypothetical protein
MAAPVFDPKRLIVVALVEGAAAVAAVLRFVFSNGAISLEKPPHLAWFVASIGVAMASVMHFVVRSSLQRARREAGGDAEDQSGQIFALSVAIAVGALAIAAAGPMPFELVLGRGE